MLSPFRSHGFALSFTVPAHLRFAIPAVRYSMEHTFDYTVTLFSPLAKPISEPCLLRLLLTSHSSLLLRLMRPSVRPHGVSLRTFPRSPVRFTYHGYGCLWDFAVFSQLIRMICLISAVTAYAETSCSSGHDFAIPSSRLFLTVQTLGVAIGFVGNYAPWDFHPRFGTCPSHQKKTPEPFDRFRSLMVLSAV